MKKVFLEALAPLLLCLGVLSGCQQPQAAEPLTDGIEVTVSAPGDSRGLIGDSLVKAVSVVFKNAASGHTIGGGNLSYTDGKWSGRIGVTDTGNTTVWGLARNRAGQVLYTGQVNYTVTGTNDSLTLSMGLVKNIVDQSYFDPAVHSLEVLQAVRDMDVYFEHASTGQSILAQMDDQNDGPYAKGGRRSYSNDDGVTVFDPTWFVSNSGIGDLQRAYSPWFNQYGAGDAQGYPTYTISKKLVFFNTTMRRNISESFDFPHYVDVAMQKFCFEHPTDNAEADNLFALYKSIMEDLQRDYPGTTFVWWTMPLMNLAPAQDDYMMTVHRLNDQIREYCRTNGQWLFDIAHLECHYTDDDGSVKAHKGVAGYGTLYPPYATDVGHLSELGRQKMAQAWWTLMGEIAKTRADRDPKKPRAP